MTNNTKIAVAMSGGVDSSVAALLLKREGHDVVGVNLNLWSCFEAPKAQRCCSPEDRRDAQAVCEHIGIPFVSIDMRDEFKKRIVGNFVEEYSKGRTPNPCIRCNTEIKFAAMFAWLEQELGIKKIATGHYAQIIEDKNGCHLHRGKDPEKDQTYFLYDIPPETLSKILFPLGEYTKDEVRKIALEEKLPVAEKDESQEVCFIPDGDVASFIENFYPDCAKPKGNFVDRKGNILGRHRGTHAYTIGQRRGLGIGFGERKYVVAIRPETNEIVLGENRDLFAKELMVKNLNLLSFPQSILSFPRKRESIIKSLDPRLHGDDKRRNPPFTADVKIRYRSEATPARIIIDGKKARVIFEKPVRAIAPGQAAVFYDGDRVVGGGWIE